nr:hypothetical protein [Pseudobutyrivibrio sp.]
FPNVKVTFILGILKDKEVDIILDELMPLAKKCYTMAVPNARTMNPKELADMIRSRGVEAEVVTNKSQLKEIISQSEVTCIAGSLYLISEIDY